MTNVTYTIDSKYATLNFSIKNGKKLNVNAKLTESLTKVVFHTEVLVQSLDGAGSGSAKYRSFMKKTINVCKFMDNPNIEPLLTASWTQFLADKRQKIVTKCPILAVRSIMGIGAKLILYFDLFFIIIYRATILYESMLSIRPRFRRFYQMWNLWPNRNRKWRTAMEKLKHLPILWWEPWKRNRKIEIVYNKIPKLIFNANIKWVFIQNGIVADGKKM